MPEQTPKPAGSTLLALTTAALALPGISPQSKAVTPPTESQFSYRLSSYGESDLPDGRVISGDAERYDIVVNQFRYLRPVGSSWALDARLQHEAMTGASPYSNVDSNNDGDIDLIMTGASIREKRTDILVGFTRYFDDASLGIDVGNSDEDDYSSNSLGARWEQDFNNRTTTVNAGISFSDDVIAPVHTFGNTIDTPSTRESKDSVSVHAGIGQVINKRSVIQTGITYTDHEGYHSDPYKEFDRRPESRLQTTWNLRYRRFIDRFDSALHLDYRYYIDSWRVKSHTLLASWYWNLRERWQLAPFVRYYSQTDARFYTPIDGLVSPSEFQSSDASLSNYGAVSAGLKVIREYNDWSWMVIAETYDASDDYALTDSDDPENPALTEYTRVTVGFDFRFD